MKKLRLWLLCVVLLVTMSACNGGGNETEPVNTSVPATTQAPETEEPTTETPTEPQMTAREAYEQARTLLDAMKDLKLEITVESSTVLGTDTFKEQNVQTLILQNIGEEGFAAKLSDATYRGTYYTKTEEVFGGGKMYYAIQPVGVNTRVDYVTEMTAQEYLDRMIPAALLDIELYESVEKNGNTLTLSGGLEAERWLGLEEADVKEASGSIQLGENGEIKNSKYSLVYELNSAVVTMKISMSVYADTGAAIDVPANTDGYKVLEGQNYLAPYMVHHTIGYISQMETLSSNATVSAVSMAAGWAYGAEETSHLYTDGKHAVADIVNHVRLTDINTGQYFFDDTVEEKYADGIYTYIYNSETPQSEPLDFSALTGGVSSIILADIPELSLVEKIEVGVYGGMILIEYGYNSQMGEELSTAVAGLMFADPTLLNTMATAYRTEVAGGYIGIDIATGIPTSVGVEYTGIHTIEGAEYALTYAMNRDFLIGDASTYKEITGEALPEPEGVPITPLLYKVTGSNGQEMWLFGTIHVGDSRTAQFPAKIQEAFDNADALAVEFNTDEFTQRLELDANLALQAFQMYMYADGSTTESHISDPEVYDYALKTLKAAGLIDAYTLQMKAASWSQNIENFYLQWIRGISGDYGVDSRLLKMAEDQQKRILEIESGLEQLGMMMGFSDKLQELLLAESISCGAVEYGKNIRELYELWCEGDEAKLTEYLAKEDYSEMTSEELALYEEYTKAMETDRNAKMLEVAKGYLESGESVFYAVGLAHLLAEDGLVNTLRDAGYTVELVTE